MTVANIEKSEQINENDATVKYMKRTSIVVRVIAFTIILVILSGLYLIYAWDRYQDEASSQAIALANSIEGVKR